MARGQPLRNPHAGRAVRRWGRQRAPDLARGLQGRVRALRHPAAVGEGDDRPRRRCDAHRRCARGHDCHARGRAPRLHGAPGAVAASRRRTRVGRDGAAVQRQGLDGLDPLRRDEPVDGRGRHPQEREERREPRNDREVRRLQAARRGEPAEGQQQRPLPARPLRGAGGGLDRPRAEVHRHGRGLRLPRAQRERGHRGGHVAGVRHHARRPPRHGGAERQDDRLRSDDPGDHRRRARQRRGCAGPHLPAGRSRRGAVPGTCASRRRSDSEAAGGTPVSPRCS